MAGRASTEMMNWVLGLWSLVFGIGTWFLVSGYFVMLCVVRDRFAANR